MSEVISKKDIMSELEGIRSQLLVMEWDKSKKQLNANKALKFEELLSRRKDLIQYLDELES